VDRCEVIGLRNCRSSPTLLVETGERGKGEKLMGMAEATIKPARPVMRYYGSKWTLAPWIISHFPQHRVYVEPFAGAASVLMQKGRSEIEIINDLNAEVVNIFKVLRNESQARELKRLIDLTPYSRIEYEASRETTDDPVEAARRAIIRSYFGHGSAAFYLACGFKSNDNTSGNHNAHGWVKYSEAMPVIINRMKGVVVECRPAVEVIKQQDSLNTLFYVDPPYVQEAWVTQQVYEHEMTDTQHEELARVLRGAVGMVVLSGYGCELYDQVLYADWHRYERDAGKRTEVLWLNASAQQALHSSRAPLFETVT
jgi:DNA adenine methylase